MHDGVPCHRRKVISEFYKSKALRPWSGEELPRSEPYKCMRLYETTEAQGYPNSKELVGGHQEHLGARVRLQKTLSIHAKTSRGDCKEGRHADILKVYIESK